MIENFLTQNFSISFSKLFCLFGTCELTLVGIVTRVEVSENFSAGHL